MYCIVIFMRSDRTVQKISDTHQRCLRSAEIKKEESHEETQQMVQIVFLCYGGGYVIHNVCAVESSLFRW